MRIRVSQMLLGHRGEKVRVPFPPWSATRGEEISAQSRRWAKLKMPWSRGSQVAAPSNLLLYMCFLCPVWYFSSTFDTEVQEICLASIRKSDLMTTYPLSSLAGMATTVGNCQPLAIPLTPPPLLCPFSQGRPNIGFHFAQSHLRLLPSCRIWVSISSLSKL